MKSEKRRVKNLSLSWFIKVYSFRLLTFELKCNLNSSLYTFHSIRSGWPDSNWRLLRPERSALPTALHPENLIKVSVTKPHSLKRRRKITNNFRNSQDIHHKKHAFLAFFRHFHYQHISTKVLFPLTNLSIANIHAFSQASSHVTHKFACFSFYKIYKVEITKKLKKIGRFIFYLYLCGIIIV